MSLLQSILKSILPEKKPMKIVSITPQEAKDLAAKGAILVDIREPGERAAGHIANDRNLPLSRLTPVPVESGGKPVIFYCASGNRTRMNASALDAIGGTDPKIMAGGIMGWLQAGFPVVRG
ncbi:MAG: rhodanese-like domain-containing protein [Hyphomicrobiales bacterium]